ncbi:hypothetical protein IE53DRAFT_205702 [Violaceomyces palustris]|uniref:Uncharacterized protein n=1 Tax=Violaceomyces palustris TaxID=1673888 RepID=A0ACD0NR59_9BASI|nr:hypothetical protein IE53DRAFT_205702 [Violaceomyces palustris]
MLEIPFHHTHIQSYVVPFRSNIAPLTSSSILRLRLLLRSRHHFLLSLSLSLYSPSPFLSCLSTRRRERKGWALPLPILGFLIRP